MLMADLDSARLHYRDARRWFEATGNTHWIIESTIALAHVLHLQGLFPQAQAELEQAIALAIAADAGDRLAEARSALADVQDSWSRWLKLDSELKS